MKLHPNLFLVTCAVAGLFSPVSSHAQTTLSGDHIVTGDLSVGTTGTTGNLLVTGDAGNTAPPGLKVTGDGGVVFTGSFGVGQIPATGAGVRLMWYSRKAAFRVGEAGTESWNNSKIGEHSFASGDGAEASQYGSFAAGAITVASGYCAAAFGYASIAFEYGSFAAGEYTLAGSFASAFGTMTSATGNASFAAGDSVVATNYGAVALGVMSDSSGLGSFAAGDTVSASGDSSTAFGVASISMGDYAFSSGFSTVALGISSSAMGHGSSASGDFSTAMGFSTSSDAMNSVAVGRYNAGGGNATEWVDTDPLFEIGNGTGDSNDPPEVERRNAVTVYKNGNVVISKRQGDIPMGEFGNPE